MILLVVGMASALVWTGVRYRKQQTKIRAFEKLISGTQQYQAPESETPGKAMTPSIEEIRQIGEAISCGNRTSDAMLILRKWASNLERAAGLGHELDLTQLLDFESLNTREREVTLLIARGFDAKEIARLTGMSNAYTYNVRSHVLAKLSIPPEADILEWLQNFSRPD